MGVLSKLKNSLKSDKLGKLTITAFQERTCQTKVGDPFAVQFNPSTLEMSRTIEYEPEAFFNDQSIPDRIVRKPPASFTFELIIQAQSPGFFTKFDPATGTVTAQIEALRKLCLERNDKTGEPNFLQVTWGVPWLSNYTLGAGSTSTMIARMTALDITCSLFDRMGAPQYATARVTLVAELSPLQLKQLTQDDQSGTQTHKDQAALPQSNLSVLFGHPAKTAFKKFRLSELDLETFVNKLPAVTARFVIEDNAPDNFDDIQSELSMCSPDALVSVKGEKEHVLFSGVVASREFSFRQGIKTLTLKLRHPLSSLNATYRSRIFVGKTDREIVNEILNAHKVKWKPLEKIPKSFESVKHTQMVQFQCSDWEFLRMRLAANGMWLMPNEEVALGKPSLGSEKLHLQKKGGVPIEEGTWTIDNQRFPKGIKVSTWDIKGQQSTTPSAAQDPKAGSGAFDASKLNPLDKQGDTQALTWSVVLGGALESTEQAALADGRLLNQWTASVRGRFTLSAQSDLKLGDTLAVSGYGKELDGKSVITGIVHRFRAQSNNWRTTVSIGLDAVREMDNPLVPEIKGVVIGKVARSEDKGANKNAKNTWPEIPVTIPAIDKENKIWARMMHPYASKDSGVIYYPEPEDEVLLACDSNDARNIYILGAMHNPKQTTPIEPKDGHRKGVVLQQKNADEEVIKHEWVFDRNDKSIELTLGTNKEVTSQMRFSEADGIAVECTDGDIAMKAKSQAKEDKGSVSLEATNELRCHGHKKSTTWVGQEAETANKPISLEMDALGQTVTIKSAGKLAVEAAATVDIKGATIDLHR
ncbi:CIS tube protein [Burkholderia cenocepacia]|uniref:CIS tube protein n=1 Tax=Burkholderia cenocepacia TaxID=95486 RepID=UPI000F5956EC|nr:contractile injection system protein, VgrG/Pvc8 family [Burkholderia cenocepacia]RQU52929.1 hypothetical protein DF143_32675 [Burkholderia cenocepacia]RQV35050.1 hypothetical protein DF033_32000 [Burkholderia cenocepacia]